VNDKVVGKITIVSKEGGLIATNIPEFGDFEASPEGLLRTKELMSDVLGSRLIGFVCVSPK
jgi:hypothetical protein